jgi:hypothetical protein
MDEPFDKMLMVHDYPECGPGSLDVEELYQAFRQRLLREMALLALAEAKSDNP